VPDRSDTPRPEPCPAAAASRPSSPRARCRPVFHVERRLRSSTDQASCRARCSTWNIRGPERLPDKSRGALRPRGTRGPWGTCSACPRPTHHVRSAPHLCGTSRPQAATGRGRYRRDPLPSMQRGWTPRRPRPCSSNARAAPRCRWLLAYGTGPPFVNPVHRRRRGREVPPPRRAPVTFPRCPRTRSCSPGRLVRRPALQRCPPSGAPCSTWNIPSVSLTQGGDRGRRAPPAQASGLGG
jgi:hypothetical protein